MGERVGRISLGLLVAVLEVIAEETGGLSLKHLSARLPRRLHPLLARGHLGVRPDASETVPADDAEDFLLCLSSLLAAGSDVIYQRIGARMAERAFEAEALSVVPGNLALTLERAAQAMRAPLLDVENELSLLDTAECLQLRVRVPGRPQLANILSHLSLGWASAAVSRCLGPDAVVTSHIEFLGDHAELELRYPPAIRRSRVSSGASGTLRRVIVDEPAQRLVSDDPRDT